MKKFLLTSLIASLFALAVQAQDLTISGGNNVSVMICADGAVYAWGMNYWEVNNNKAGNGNLGTSNTTDDYVTKPTKVNMPSEALPVKQVDAGSGSHFVAMGCNGTVWCWGNNATKQAGNPSAGNPVLVPVQVKAGEVPSVSGYLEGVSYISGGNDENYAILATGELVAWGQNDVGQLGCGRTSTYESTPVYVCKPDGSHLTGVIMVEAGDETGYALVDEDGDGIGTVYSWGGDGASQLGRVASTSEPKYYACPCYKNAGDPTSPSKGELLDNIVSLTAGDCMAIMIDKDSYVWSFGHGSWGGMCGSWAWGCDCCYANQVLGGETGEPYLKAKAVSAGQGFGMAVTLDGKAVAWGNNGATNRSGGNLGNGGDDASPDPVYIRKTATTLMENCASISDGDTWGFITTTDNEIWTWGDNCVGQLGIGSTTRGKYAAKMNRLCQVPDPKPVISFPEDFYTCVPFSFELNSNFVNTNNNYSYEWFKDGKALTSLGNKKTSITVDEVGTYSLKLSYIGANSPCGMDPVESEITISAYEPEFSVPTGLTFCPPNMKPRVDGKGVYNYYTSQTGGFLLGTSYQDKETTFASSAVTEKTSDGKYTIYVEEAGNSAGITHKSTAREANAWSSKEGNSSYIQIKVFQDVVLDSLTLWVKGGQAPWMKVTQTSWYPTNEYDTTFGVGAVGTYQIGVYDGAAAPGSLVSSSAEYSGMYFSDTVVAVTIPLNISLKGSSGGEVYWLTTTKKDGDMYYAGTSGTFPYVDDAGGDVLHISAAYQYGAKTWNPPFHNLAFHTSQHFCDRIPMTLIEDCPCEKPETVKITADKTNLCPGETTTLTTNSQDASLFSYVWYDADGNQSTPISAASASTTVDFDNPGIYKVVIYDKTQQLETTSCKKEATIEIKSNPYPTAVISGGGEYCEGKTVSDVSIKFTGTAPFKYTYNENGKEGTSKTATTASATITPSKTVAAGDAYSEYVYTMASLSDANCTTSVANLTTTNSGSAKVVIGAVPTATIIADPVSAQVCAPATVDLTGESSISVATLAWGGIGSGNAANLSASKSGDYTLTASNKVSSTLTCTSEKATQKVTIDAKPTLTISSDKAAVCSGETITFTASAKVDGKAVTTGKYTWTCATGTGATATLSKTATWPNVEEATVMADYETEAGCKADQSNVVTVKFNPAPNAPSESNTASYCMDPSKADETLKATADKNCTLQWYEKNGTTKLSKAPSISIKSANTYEYKVTQSYEGCESEPTTISIVVNEKLKPTIEINSNELCIGGTTDVTVQDANKYTVVWSGDASTAGFGSTSSSKTPTFTAPSVTSKKDYTVHVYVENTECNGENEATITVYPTPTVTLSVDDADICDGEKSNVTAAIAGDDGSGSLMSYTWKNADDNGKTSGVLTGSNTSTTDKTETITYSYIGSHGCKAADATTTVTVRATPVAPTVEAYTKCLDATEESLEAYVTKKTGTLNWYGTNATGGTASSTAPTGKTDKVVSPAVNYYVSQTVNGCEGERAALPVTINANLEPVITASETSGLTANDGEVCAGTAITLSTGGNYTETWTAEGAGSTYLQVTSNSRTFLGTAPAGTYTINLAVEDENHCKGSASKTLKVNAIPKTSLSVADADHCISVTEAQTITATASESGTGTWGGDVENTSNSTADFIPSKNTAGKHTMTYDFTSVAGCDAAQSDIDMTVYALPTPSIEVSNKVVCHDGTTNMDVVTVTSKNTVAAGTFAYTVDKGTVDASNGSFDPTANAVGEYTITLTYTDLNGCTNTTNDKLNVYGKPEVSITAPTEVCYNAAASTLTPVASPAGGSGVWSGTSAAKDGSFNPKSYSEGTNTVGYTYTDSNGCTNSANTEIDVVKINAPTTSGTATVMINDGTGMISGEGLMEAMVAETGDILQWFEGDKGSNGGTVASFNEGIASYTMPTDMSTSEGAYPYTVRSYRVVNGANCYSDSATARVVVTKCSAIAPDASDIYICMNDKAPNTELSSTKKSSLSEDDSYIAWMSEDPVAKTTSEVESKLLTTVGTDSKSFVASIPMPLSIGDYPFYVAEYHKTGDCWSAGTKVTVHVVDTPTVSITMDPDYCAHGTDAVQVQVTPQTGTLSFKGGSTDMGSLDGFSWTPGDYAGASLTGTFVYTVKSQTYADGTECYSAPEQNITAHYMEPLDGSTTNWLLKLADNVPALPAYTSAKPTETVTWYANQNKTNKIGDDNAEKTYSTGDLSAIVAGLDEYHASYWATRTDAYGCESEAAEVKLIMAECPWAAPIVPDITICSGDVTALTLVGTPGDLSMATSAGVTGWRWNTTENNSAEYATGLSNIAEGTASVTEYKVSYKAAEKNSGAECWSPETTVKVTVNPLPVVEIEQIGTLHDGGTVGVLCYADGTFMATAKVNGVVTSGGEWSTLDVPGRIESASGIIDAKLSVDGSGAPIDLSNTARYTYTDANGCVNHDDQKFYVEYPEVPTTEKYIGITTKPEKVRVTASNIEESVQTVTEINWYRSMNANKTIGTGNPWMMDEDVVDPSVVSDGELTFYVSQTVNGCASERAEQIVEIVDCPWTVEEVTPSYTCSGVDFTSGMKATSNAGANPEKWSWSKSSEIMNEVAGLTGTESEYTQTDKTTQGVTTYYVRYYAYYEYADASCWSAPKAVTTTVYSNPVLSFAESKGSVCYTDGAVKINVNVTPSGDGEGVTNEITDFGWTTSGASGAIATETPGYAYFQTDANEQATKTYTIGYETTDEKGCYSETEREIEVIYLPKPETIGFYAMSNQTHPVEVKVTSTVASGAEIHWFGDAITMSSSEKKNKVINGDGSNWATGDAENRVVERSYFARQYDGSANCYSEPAEAVVKIVPCPIPNVIVNDESACIYDAIPSLTASTGDWEERDASKSKYRFYTSSDATTAFEYESGDGSYTPTTLTAAGTYSYYVSEFNSDPLEGLTYTNEGCEGSRIKANITIIETPAPKVSPATASVCEGEINPKFTAVSAVSDVLWFENNPGERGLPTIDYNGMELSFIPTSSDASADAYGVWALRYSNGCYSARTKVEYIIKGIPTAPVSERVEVCDGVVGTLTAEVGDDAIVNWFADSKKKDYLAQGKSYQPKDEGEGEYTYYVAQSVNGCWGPAADVVYEIKPIPNQPIVPNPGNLCEYDAAPELNADETKYENVRWYTAADRLPESLLSTGNIYSLTRDEMTSGTKRYYVTQTRRDCESEATAVVFSIYPKPTSPKVIGSSVCEGDTLIPTLSTDFSNDAWYADEDAQTLLTKGYTYTPSSNEVGNTDKIYFVVREQRGCYSDTVPDTLHVIAKPTFFIGNDTIICVYEQLPTIQAQNYVPAITEGSYINWKVSSGNVSKAVGDNENHNIYPSAVGNGTGIYTVTASYRYKYDNIFCNSEEISMNFTVKDRARKPIVFTKTICQGEEIKDLQALGSQNVVWKSLSGTLPEEFHGPKYHFQPGQVLDTGTYRFEIYDMNIYDEEDLLGCESVHDTVMMVVAPGANTKLFGRDSVCLGANGESYYTQYEESSQYFWQVTGSHLNYSKDATSSSVRYIDWMEVGIDTLTVYEQTWAGCEGFDTLIVKIAPAPIAHFNWTMPGAGNVIELTDSTIQDSLWTTDENGDPLALPIEYTLAWNFGHQGDSESQIDTLIPFNMRKQPIQEGGYLYGYNCPILTVTNDFGCKDFYTECIFVNLASSLYVPTAFSPSNPAHSVRTFQPKGFNLATCKISVYDKWGNLLWYSDEVEDGKFVGYWDGTYDGKMMKSDVYIWQMEATFLDGQKWQGFDAGNGKKTKFGSVTLVR